MKQLTNNLGTLTNILSRSRTPAPTGAHGAAILYLVQFLLNYAKSPEHIWAYAPILTENTPLLGQMSMFLDEKNLTKKVSLNYIFSEIDSSITVQM